MVNNTIDHDEVKQIQVEILKKVHEICEKNNIKYFLSDGTLLGAIRHSGFIPWDDDIDIGMLRSELIKFEDIIKTELPDYYFYQSLKTDKYWTSPVCRIIDKRTSCEEKYFININIQKGIFIDIQPYDFAPKSNIARLLHKKMFYLFSILTFGKLHDTAFLSKNDFSFKKKIIRIIFYPFYFFVPLKFFKYLLYKIITFRQSLFTTKFGGNYDKNMQYTYLYEETIKHSFENYLFYIPKNYHKILSSLYGNYMELPPVEKRTGGHGLTNLKRIHF